MWIVRASLSTYSDYSSDRTEISPKTNSAEGLLERKLFSLVVSSGLSGVFENRVIPSYVANVDCIIYTCKI